MIATHQGEREKADIDRDVDERKEQTNSPELLTELYSTNTKADKYTIVSRIGISGMPAALAWQAPSHHIEAHRNHTPPAHPHHITFTSSTRGRVDQDRGKVLFKYK